jgi:hypothetical protein
MKIAVFFQPLGECISQHSLQKPLGLPVVLGVHQGGNTFGHCTVKIQLEVKPKISAEFPGKNF